MAALAEKHYTVCEANKEKLAAKLSSKRERKRGIHGLQSLPISLPQPITHRRAAKRERIEEEAERERRRERRYECYELLDPSSLNRVGQGLLKTPRFNLKGVKDCIYKNAGDLERGPLSKHTYTLAESQRDTKMEDSGAILCHISTLKDMLDQVKCTSSSFSISYLSRSFHLHQSFNFQPNYLRSLINCL